MKLMLTARAIGVTALAGLALAACGTDNNPGAAANPTAGTGACASGSITGQGSTFQANIVKQWASQFAGQCPGAQVTYTGTGSGAGVTQFGKGTIDFAGDDAALKPDERSAADAACGSTALEVPVTAGGIAVIYNIKGVTNLQLSAPTLAGIFNGSIKSWNDAKIRADNPDATLPATTIKTYHRADGSGTTKVFTGFLMAAAPSDWKLGSDKTISWPSGQGANGSSGVVAGVKSTDGGITYAEVSYAEQDSLPTAKVKGAGSSYVSISSDTVSQSIESGYTVTGTGNDLSGTLDYTKMTGYPISTVSYDIVCSKYKDASKGKIVKAFLLYALGSGQSQVDALGYAPLPSDLARKAQASIGTIS